MAKTRQERHQLFVTLREDVELLVQSMDRSREWTHFLVAEIALMNFDGKRRPIHESRSQFTADERLGIEIFRVNTIGKIVNFADSDQEARELFIEFAIDILRASAARIRQQLDCKTRLRMVS